ncbi:MAG: hypothetical protein IJV82_05350 [Oscillospiraceae bacterium]|nr:hypothetical protein [Oscillospiraceae bacterium]
MYKMSVTSKRTKRWLCVVAVVMALSVFIGGCASPSRVGSDNKLEEISTATTSPQTASTDSGDNNQDDNQSNDQTFPGKRTVMLYIVGSDLESDRCYATNDISEMLDAQIDSSEVEIVLCAGGAKTWNNDVISPSETSYYEVTEDSVIKVHQSGKENMGLSTTLSEFLNWSFSNYPADRFSLFFWDHGGGPLYGYGFDELSGDNLSIAELATALEDSPFHSGNKLEILGFDACLMGTAETAWAFRNYADYFVASQELEPGYGWNYEFLSRLPNCSNGADIGKVIIDYYFDFYDWLASLSPRMDMELTLSCVDLSKMERVEEAIDQLFYTVDQDVITGQLATASRCRYRSKAFGKNGSSNAFDLVDLKHMASLLSNSYSQASELEKAVSDAVVYSKSNVNNAYGLSIYHPYEDITQQRAIKTIYRSLNFAPQYFNYISDFMSGLSNSAQSQSSYRNFSRTMGSALTDGEAHNLAIQLTEEQLRTFSSAQYYVFWEIPGSSTFSHKTEYLQVFSGQNVSLSADNRLTATYGGKAVYGKNYATGAYSDCPLSMNQIYDGTMEEKYYFPCMFWVFDGDFDLDPVNWLMKMKDGVPTLLQASHLNSIIENTPDKQFVNPDDYDMYTFSNNSYFVNTDSNGNTVFTFSGSSYGFEYTKEDGFSIELRPIADKSQFRAVFLIEDIYGNHYFSDFIPLA